MKQIHCRCCPQTVISHPSEVVEANGAVVSSTAPSRQVIAAAFVLSTLVVHNRQHNKLVSPQLLKSVVSWIRGQDSSCVSQLDALGRSITLQSRAISIARDLAVNAAMHDELNSASVAEVRPR